MTGSTQLTPIAAWTPRSTRTASACAAHGRFWVSSPAVASLSECRARRVLATPSGWHDQQARGGHDDLQDGRADLVGHEQVAAHRLHRDVGRQQPEETATAFCVRRSEVSDRRRLPVKRQMTMTLARPSMTEPSAQPTRLMPLAWMPASRPSGPSRVIHDSHRTLRTAGPCPATPAPVPQLPPHEAEVAGTVVVSVVVSGWVRLR